MAKAFALATAVALVSTSAVLGAFAAERDFATVRLWQTAGGSSVAEAKTTGRIFQDCSDGCPQMVVIPSGRFLMGSELYNREKPRHPVRFDTAIAVSRFETTFDEWDACVRGGGCVHNSAPSDEGWGRGRRPVINVSWNDAKDYVSWLSHKTGKTYRLLTEAEYEYAARAGSTTTYFWGRQDRLRQGKLRRRTRLELRGARLVFAARNAVGRYLFRQPVGPSRHARKCLGMVRGQLAS